MVMRYFRSKAGLFTAAVTMDLRVPDLRSVPASRRGELLVGSSSAAGRTPLHDDELIALLRTAVTSQTVAERLQAVLGQLITEPIAALAMSGRPSAARSSQRNCSAWPCAGTSCASSRWPRCRLMTWWPPSPRRCSVT